MSIVFLFFRRLLYIIHFSESFKNNLMCTGGVDAIQVDDARSVHKKCRVEQAQVQSRKLCAPQSNGSSSLFLLTWCMYDIIKNIFVIYKYIYVYVCNLCMYVM